MRAIPATTQPLPRDQYVFVLRKVLSRQNRLWAGSNRKSLVSQNMLCIRVRYWVLPGRQGDARQRGGRHEQGVLPPPFDATGPRRRDHRVERRPRRGEHHIVLGTRIREIELRVTLHAGLVVREPQTAGCSGLASMHEAALPSALSCQAFACPHCIV